MCTICQLYTIISSLKACAKIQKNSNYYCEILEKCFVYKL